MKAEKISIKWKIMLYMLVFVAVTLVLLWLFQVVFLSSFYKRVKIHEVKEAANEIIELLQQGELQDDIDKLILKDNICIRIVNQQGKELFSEKQGYPCLIDEFNEDELQKLFEQISDIDDESISVIETKRFYRFGEGRGNRNRIIDEESSASENSGSHNTGDNISKTPYRKVMNLMYARKVENSSKIPVLLLINTTITPIGSTENILKIELFYIIFILVIVSGILAYVMYHNISYPIMQINKRAKELALGIFVQSTVKGGYKEIVQLNDTMNYAAEELARTENVRRELLANLSHDLRTPLTMITGYGEIMRDIPGENTAENIQIIIDEAIRLTRLVNDILDVSKFQSGKISLNKKEFNLTRCIEDILKNYTELLQKEGFNICFEKEEIAYVLADEVKIAQVIYNLINNAVNYSGESKKIVIRQRTEENTIKIEVIDYGNGIDEKEKRVIWERYYKSDKEQKTQDLGTGLGLSIVKNILELHQTDYGVESQKGKGSNFWFCLDKSK